MKQLEKSIFSPRYLNHLNQVFKSPNTFSVLERDHFILAKSSVSRKEERWLTDEGCSQSFAVTNISFFITQSWCSIFFNSHSKTVLLISFSYVSFVVYWVTPLWSLFSFFTTAEHWGENSFLCLVKGWMLDLRADSQTSSWWSQDNERESLWFGDFDSHQEPPKYWPNFTLWLCKNFTCAKLGSLTG